MPATEIHVHVVNVTHLRGSRWSMIRWCFGLVSLVLWLAASASAPVYTPGRRILFLCALMSVEAFAVMSATLMLLPSEQATLKRITNWLAIIFSIMAWVPGCAAAIWLGLGVPDGAILVASVIASFVWFGLAVLSEHD